MGAKASESRRNFVAGRRWLCVRIAAAGLVMFSGACSGGLIRGNSADSGDAPAATDSGPDSAGGTPGSTQPGAACNAGVFAPLPADKYTRKIKAILTGTAATQDEVDKVSADASSLRALVVEWMQSPAYQQVILDFFTTAFQQNNITAEEFETQYFTFAYPNIDARLVQNISESFGRTAIELIDEGRPFTDTMTTRRFMMTPPMMMFMALVDARQTGDNASPSESMFYAANANLTQFTLSPSNIPVSQSLNPQSPNYMVFYSPQTASATGLCHAPYTITQKNNSIYQTLSFITTLYDFIATGSYSYFLPTSFLPVKCAPAPAQSGFVAAEDYASWRMVTVRQPNKQEPTTATQFFQYPTIKNLNTLVLTTPRVGFYTTLAFFNQWNTNASNQFRLTMNQALIVALGTAFDGAHGAMTPGTNPALDLAHAAPGTTCYGCHVTLDPMRQYFRQQYTLYFSRQTDSSLTSIPGYFAFDEVSAAGTGIADLGAHFASHPDFAQAWTQKLCTWATGAPCATADPEFVRLVNVFSGSQFNWNTLMVEMFTSPLVTFAEATQTQTASGGASPVLKRLQLCLHLATSLGIDDPCGLDASTKSRASLGSVATIAQILPSDEYGRGSTAPTQSNDPGLFFHAGIENTCLSVAQLAVDGTATAGFSSSDPNAAIAGMVHTMMAIVAPADATPISILTQHYQDAIAQGNTPTSALRSAFVVSCMSPPSVGLGE